MYTEPDVRPYMSVLPPWPQSIGLLGQTAVNNEAEMIAEANSAPYLLHCFSSARFIRDNGRNRLARR